MLRFLFGKSSGKKEDSPSPARQAPRHSPKPQPAAAPVPDPVPLASRLAELAAHVDGDPAILEVAMATGPAELRDAALARIHDAAQLVRVACEARSADSRHAAVLRITEESLLTQVAHQARTRDKRVYKVARDRLDGYARERERHAMQARWLETVEALAAQANPELSRVVEVEKVWAALQPDPEADARFQQARARLHACFQAQAEERRQARRQAEEPQGDPTGTTPGDSATATPESAIAGGAADDAGSAPAGVAAAGSAGADSAAAGDLGAAAGRAVVAGEVVATEGAIAAEGAIGAEGTIAADGTIVAGPASAAADSLAQAAGADPRAADPARAGSADGGAGTSEAGAATAPVSGKPGGQDDRRERGGGKRKPELDAALRDKISHEIEALEHALEEGHLHEAETHLATLSELQSQAGGVAGSLGGRIRRAVEEIARLRAWRRWGGQQARDHLCDAAEALPGRELPPDELGRAIKALRTQWHSIATSEGGAPQHLWERFDAACERAWEPVKEHFARQAERRAGNLERRQAMLAELEAKAASLDTPPVEWKTVAFTLSDASRRWHTLGPVDRKLSKSLEARYAAATGTMERRLRLVRDAEASEREALIRRAEQLAERVDGRDVVAKLRELQGEWQTRSRAVPLERAREQALWERFRAVCDGLFHARDAARAADDAERAAHAAAENAEYTKRAELWRGLREGALACSAAEQALAGTADGDAERLAIGARLATAWQALPETGGRDAAPVHQRQQKLVAVCEGRESLADLLAGFAESAERYAHGLLELEIALGLPSPPELHEARRRLQIEKLADHLRSGGRPDHDGQRRPALALCALPAPQAALAQRLDAVLQALAPKPPERRAPAHRAERAPRSGEREARPRGDRGDRGQRDGRGRPAGEGRGPQGRRPDA